MTEQDNYQTVEEANESVQARGVVEDAPAQVAMFGETPNDFIPNFDLSSNLLEDLICRYPVIIVKKAGYDESAMPDTVKIHKVDAGWEIQQMGEEVLLTSAGEYAWVDFASIDENKDRPYPVIIAKRVSASMTVPYFVMKNQLCQIQSLLGQGVGLKIPSLDWHCSFDAGSLSPEWSPSKLGLHDILSDEDEKVGELMVCEPKELPPKQGTIAAQADRTIDAMVDKALSLGWEGIDVVQGDRRSLFSLWVACQQKEMSIDNDQVGYTPYFETKLGLIETVSDVKDDFSKKKVPK